MKYFFIISFMVVGYVSFAQNNKPTKSQIIKVLKESIDQESKKSVSIGSGEWTICNQDSAFFKADTIRIYSKLNYFYQKSSCCDFVNWTFYRKDAFVQSTSQICNEPASGGINTEYCRLSFIRDNKRLLLAIIFNSQKLELFEIVSLNNIILANNLITKEITLKRYIKYGPIIGPLH